MSAIDIVLVVIALVAVGVAVACALQLKSLRAELRERGDSSAETLAALEQANNALDALNVALAETRRTANAIAQQQTTDAAVGQQRYLTIAREFSQAGDRMDDLRRETAHAETVAAARKTLDTMVKREAKDICEKYLSVPATTNFGIMFVPFEGLYAEVVSRPGLIETLGRDYHVNVAGPSTMAAILNSLQMSYQTFKLQKRTDDVLRVLSAVKAELPRYQKALRRAQQQIETAGKTVEGIITTRTNVMERKLKDIDALEDAEEADEILGLTSASLLADQKDED